MQTAAVITLASLCFVSSPQASTQIHQEFNTFKTKFGKVYKSHQEELERFQIFKENYFHAAVRNGQRSSYTTGITQFSDLTTEEFKANFLGFKRAAFVPNNNEVRISSNLPDSINWVDKGAVTSVKNQGHCGSCWAFATTEQIESYAQINTGKLLELSTQQVTSCSPNDVQCGGSGGCFGSVTQLGFNYLQLFGQMTEADYPYESGSSGSTGQCSYDSSKAAVSLTGYNTLPANNQSAVMTHLAEVGPLAIAVDASQWGFYTGGVFDGCSFDDNISINHGVQLVGYGSDFGPLGVYDYWLVRNSWGKSWGEDGYIRLARTAECGINSTPMDGTACVNGPGTDQQKVCGMCGMLFDASFPIGVTTL